MKKILATISTLIPNAIVFAQAPGKPTTFAELINLAVYYIGRLIPLTYALIIAVFIWGIALFIMNSDNEDGIKKGKSFMFWAVIALFVAFSFQALVYFVGDNILGTGSDRTSIINNQIIKDKVLNGITD